MYSRPCATACFTRILEDIQLAAKVGKAAHQVAIAPKLADEGTTAEEADAVVAEADALKKISGEVVAHKAHLAALRQIQNLAKRKFPSDKTARANYGIGVPNFGDNRETLETLEALTTDILTRAATEGFPGNIQTKIAAAIALFDELQRKPRTSIGGSATKRRELTTGTADLMEQLTDLDDLVAQLEPTAPNSPSIPGRTPEAVAAFIADWKRVRKVIDAGHGPIEEDQPPTPPTPPTA